MYYKFIIYQNKKFCLNILYAVFLILKFRVRNGNIWLVFQIIYIFNCYDYNFVIFFTINYGYFIIIVFNLFVDFICLLFGEDQCYFGSIYLFNVYCINILFYYFL